MTGEQLHEIWANAMHDQGVEVDTWDELGEDEQEAWRQVALVFNESA